MDIESPKYLQTRLSHDSPNIVGGLDNMLPNSYCRKSRLVITPAGYCRNTIDFTNIDTKYPIYWWLVRACLSSCQGWVGAAWLRAVAAVSLGYTVNLLKPMGT